MRLLPFRAVLLVVLVSGLGWMSSQAQTLPSPAVETAGVRRINISQDRMPAVLAQVEQGSLVRMTPEALERLLRDSKDGQRLRKRAPSLVDSRYRARYVAGTDGESHLLGTSEWTIRKPMGGSDELSLDGLQVAVRQAKWSDGQEAVLYKPPGAVPVHLHVPAAGDHTLNLEWSARGFPEPGEIRFELRVPASAISTLELELPEGLSPVLPQGEVLLTGPFPSGKGESLWKIAFGGASRLEIVLRRSSSGTSPLFARLIAVQRIGGSEGSARYEFQIESAKTGFSELVFSHDAMLTPTSVSVNNLESWQPGLRSGTPSLTVRLKEPTRVASIVVNGTFPVEKLKSWRSPALSLNDTILRKETLELVLNAGLRIRDWNAGSYRLSRAARNVDRTFSLELEPSMQIGPIRERPSLSLDERSSPGWAVVQHAEWIVNSTDERCVVKTKGAADVTLPPYLSFVLPAGWEVDRASIGSRDPNWSVTISNPRRLRIERLPSDRNEEIVVGLRRARVPSRQSELAFPDLYPEGHADRKGTLVVRVDGSLEATSSRPTGAAPANEITRELTGEPLAETLYLSDRPNRSLIELESELLAVRGRQTIRTTMEIRPDKGPVHELRLSTSGAVVEPWEWRDNRGQQVATAVRSPSEEVVSVLLAAAPLSAGGNAVTIGALGRTEWRRWTLRFSKPIDRPTSLATEYVSPGPKLTLVGLAEGGYSAKLRAPRGQGLPAFDSRITRVDSLSREYSEFRYGNTPSSTTTMGLHARPTTAIDGLTLITALNGDGGREATFRFRLRGWIGGNVPVELPSDAAHLRLTVGHRLVAVPPLSESKVVAIPVPESDEWTEIVLRYCLSPLTSRLIARLETPRPQGPFDQALIRCLWHISPEWGVRSSSFIRAVPVSIINTDFGVRESDLGQRENSSVNGSESEDFSRVVPGWVVLEDDLDSTEGMLVYRRERMKSATWIAALLLGVCLFVMIGQIRARRLIALFGVLTALVFLSNFVRLPDVGIPVLTVSIVCFVLRGSIPKTDVTPIRATQMRFATGLLLVSVTATAALSAADAQRTDVLQTIDSEGVPTAVYVPTAFADALRKGGQYNPPPIVITSAVYTGARDGGNVRIRARFKLYAFRDNANGLTIPLQGARQRRVLLDGAEARDVEAGPEGLRVSVAGKGNHVLELEFTVALVSAGSEREARLTLPEVPISALNFEVGGATSGLRMSSWRGAVRLTANARGQVLDGDIGLNSSLAIRWQEGVDRASPRSTRSASVWQIGPSAATLLSSVEFRPSGSLINEVTVFVPDNAELVRVAARGEQTATATMQLSVKDWTLAPSNGGTHRKLTVQLLVPTAGRIGLLLEMAAKVSPANRLSLTYPRTRTTTEEAYAALDVRGIEIADAIETEGLTDSSSEQFVQNTWPSIEGSPYVGKPVKAFRQTDVGFARLSCSLGSPVNAVAIDEQVVWTFRPGRLSSQTETRWTGASLALLEWTVGAGLTVSGISAKNLVSWSQSGRVVQVWLDRPHTDVLVSWTGWKNILPGEQSRFELPSVRHADVRSITSTARITALEGWSLMAVDPQTANRTPPSTGSGEIAWKNDAPSPTFLAFPPIVGPMDLQTELVAASNITEAVSTLSLASLPTQRPHSFHLFLRNAGEANVRVELPAGGIAVEGPVQNRVRQWSIHLPANRGAGSLTTRTGLGRDRVNIPRVWLHMGPRKAQLNETVRISTERCCLVELNGVTRTGPSEWRVTDETWPARISWPESALPSGDEKVRQEVQAARQGTVWLYQARYRFAPNVTPPLRLSIPGELNSRRFKLNGVPVSNDLTLPTEIESRSLMCTWQTDEPLWLAPQVVDSSGALLAKEIEWSIRAPAGFELEPPGETLARAGSTLEHDPEAFSRGTSLKYRISVSESLDVRLAPSRNGTPVWPLYTALGLWAFVALLVVLWPVDTRPEQIGGIGAAAVLAFGLAAMPLAVLPLAIVLWRMAWLAHRVSVRRTRPLPVQTS